MIILLGMGYHLLLKKEKEKNITYSGHSEPGIQKRKTDTKMLPDTNARF